MTNVTPLAHTVKDACAIAGLSRTTIYEAIKTGELAAHKCGTRTLIRHEDLKGFIDGLPRLDTAEAA